MNIKKAKQFKYQSVPCAQLPKKFQLMHKFYSNPMKIFNLNKSGHFETFNRYRRPQFPIWSGSIFSKKHPNLVTKSRLNFIVLNLVLSQRQSEELAKLLNEHNIFSLEDNVTGYRKRKSVIQIFSPSTKSLWDMEISYDSADCRLFIDSSKQSLKAVLLHKTNKKPISKNLLLF